MIFVRSAYNYDIKAASDEAALQPEDVGESLTVQSQTEDADINVMMYRFGITGKFPQNPRIPSYGDYTDVGDYRTALERLKAADEAFMEYPAQFRARFDNDPQRFLEFVSDERNREEARALGLLKEVTNGTSQQAGSTRKPQESSGTVQPSGTTTETSK